MKIEVNRTEILPIVIAIAGACIATVWWTATINERMDKIEDNVATISVAVNTLVEKVNRMEGTHEALVLNRSRNNERLYALVNGDEIVKKHLASAPPKNIDQHTYIAFLTFDTLSADEQQAVISVANQEKVTVGELVDVVNIGLYREVKV